jgi:hypothetical protein
VSKRLPDRAARFVYLVAGAVLSVGTLTLFGPAFRGRVAAASANRGVDCSSIGRWHAVANYHQGDTVWLWDGSRGMKYECTQPECGGEGTTDDPRMADDPASSRSWQLLGMCKPPG